MTEKKALYIGSIINILEWSEFSFYAFCANVVSGAFIPGHDEHLKLKLVFLIMAIGYLARPLGSVLFGYIGDVFGKKRAILASLCMMSIPTMGIAILPKYSTIGILSPIILIIIRIFQGVAVSGNYGNSYAFVVERAPKKSKHFAGSAAAFGTIFGILVGSGMHSLLHMIPGGEENPIAWRGMFGLISLAGAIMLIFSYCNVKDDKPNIPTKSTLPIIELRQYLPEIFCICCVLLLDSAGISMWFVVFPTYVETFAHISSTTMSHINTINMFVMVAFILVFGLISDKVSGKKVMLFVTAGYIFLSYPCFTLINTGNVMSVFMGQFISAIMMGACYGAAPATVVLALPKHIRCSGVSITANVMNAIFGGLMANFAISFTEYFNGSMQYMAIPFTIIGLMGLIGIWKLQSLKIYD